MWAPRKLSPCPCCLWVALDPDAQNRSLFFSSRNRRLILPAYVSTHFFHSCWTITFLYLKSIKFFLWTDFCVDFSFVLDLPLFIGETTMFNNIQEVGPHLKGVEIGEVVRRCLDSNQQPSGETLGWRSLSYRRSGLACLQSAKIPY